MFFVYNFDIVLIQDSLKQKDSDNRMFDNFGCDTQWAAMAFHQGIQESKGDYIVLQHNDTFYHGDRIDELIKHMEKNKLEYVSADNKKIGARKKVRKKTENFCIQVPFSKKNRNSL